MFLVNSHFPQVSKNFGEPRIKVFSQVYKSTENKLNIITPKILFRQDYAELQPCVVRTIRKLNLKHDNFAILLFCVIATNMNLKKTSYYFKNHKIFKTKEQI